MTIQEIGSIGEAIGAVAVVVSLVYLAVQIRQSSAIERARAEQALHDTFTEYAWRLTDPRWLRVLPKGLRSWTALSDSEKTDFNMMMQPFLGNLANGIQFREKGLLNDAALDAMAGNLLSCLLMPGGREWWEESKDGIYPEVVELIDAALARPDTLPPSWEDFFPYWMRLAD